MQNQPSHADSVRSVLLPHVRSLQPALCAACDVMRAQLDSGNFDAQELVARLRQCPYFRRPFSAKVPVVLLALCVPWFTLSSAMWERFTDVVGPGTRQGLNLVLGRFRHDSSCTDAELQAELADLWRTLSVSLR